LESTKWYIFLIAFLFLLSSVETNVSCSIFYLCGAALRVIQNQQPTVDFTSSSTSAQPGLALQDSNVLCLHKDDVRESICILAVQGYGEEAHSVTSDRRGEQSQSNGLASTKPGRPSPMEHKDASATVRGIRSWVEAVGGASICCSQCCSPLGFASIESPVTYRFLKHRLSIGSGRRIPSSAPRSLAMAKPTEKDVDFEMVPMSSGASFLARELVRYADAKAIFTFVVAQEEPEHFGAMGHASPSSAGKCLLLRLLSWDTVLASRFESPASPRLQFNRVAKIVFEETVDKLAATRKGTGHGEDISNWIWGGVDLCCLPSGQQQQFDGVDNKGNQGQDLLSGIIEQGGPPKRSAVRLQLPAEEWNEVRTTILEGSQWFSKSVSEATILVKMGPNSSPTVGLSAISL
jgi:hypothetical protein